MSQKIEIQPQSDRELAICRIMNAPAEKVYKGWTDVNLIPKWFAPMPWTTSRAELDVRPGGSSLVVMKSPEGHEFPNPGVYLEVVPNKKLVFTDAYTRAWEPSAKPMMTVELTFEDLGNGQSKYTARAFHWTKEDREQHEKMGFKEGWGICADQLEAVVSKL